jgi:hypothetical protein
LPLIQSDLSYFFSAVANLAFVGAGSFGVYEVFTAEGRLKFEMKEMQKKNTKAMEDMQNKNTKAMEDMQKKTSQDIKVTRCSCRRPRLQSRCRRWRSRGAAP